MTLRFSVTTLRNKCKCNRCLPNSATGRLSRASPAIPLAQA
jgi:hypothetical protein